ncbi:MAG: DUF6232 family protein [Hyphomicrobium sp.]|nr:hypothetical protein [Hyphomicrobium sp.]
MANAMIDGDLPPRWGLKQVAPDQRILWIGSKRIALDDIQTITAEEVRERPVQGLLAGAAIFLIVAMFLAFIVFENGWRDRFLLGTVFLSGLGLAGLFETTKIRTQRFFEVKIATGSQGLVTFASANIREVEALLAALAGAGVKA